MIQSARQKHLQDPISTNGWAQWPILVIPAVQGSMNRRIAVQANLDIKRDSIIKIPKTK
jgi:hypothetical protein